MSVSVGTGTASVDARTAFTGAETAGAGGSPRPSAERRRSGGARGFL
ncbi:hypothetical protein [Halopenitus persicus]|nr:hypothetical protein [Halopenitus persicus]